MKHAPTRRDRALLARLFAVSALMALAGCAGDDGATADAGALACEDGAAAADTGTDVSDVEAGDVDADDVDADDVDADDVAASDADAGSASTCATAAECNDANPCTEDRCMGSVGALDCVHIPIAGPCSDGDPCTDVDTCVNGACAPGAPVDCDDGKLCTDDSCDSAGECLNIFQAGPCDDGDPCTTGDICHFKWDCVANPVDCDDDDWCTADACVVDLAAPATGTCVHDVVPDGSFCSDGQLCTAGDTCQQGGCVPGPPMACDDGDPCTIDACDGALGGCVGTPTPGLACGGGGVCGGAGCVCPPGLSLVNGVCTAVLCDPVGTLPMQSLSTPLLDVEAEHEKKLEQTPINTVFRGDWLIQGWQRPTALSAAAPYPGHVAIWRKVAGVWSQQQTLTHPATTGAMPTYNSNVQGGQGFGFGVTADAGATTLLVQTPATRRIDTYERDASGVYQHVPAAVLIPFTTGSPIPVRMATDGLTLVASNVYNGAKIYRRVAGAGWTLEATLTAGATISNYTWTWFGASAVVDGDRVLIGAPHWTGNLPDWFGAIAVFERSASGVWSPVATLTETGTPPGTQFGDAMTLHGDTLVVTSKFGGCQQLVSSTHPRGHVTVFRRQPNGAWQQEAKLHPMPLGACTSVVHFGRALALSGDELFVAAPNAQHPDAPGLLGALFHYHRSASGSWTLVDRPRPAGPLPGQVTLPLGSPNTGMIGGTFDMQFAGLSIDAHDGVLAAWAPGRSGLPGRVGRVDIFEPVPGSATDDGLCICAPGASGPDCSFISCTDAADCDDGNSCTTDSCTSLPDPTKPAICTYAHVQDYLPCEDGDACWVGEVCKFGVCMGGGALDCDDNDVCTVDSCTAASGCAHVASTDPLCAGPVLCNPLGSVALQQEATALLDAGNPDADTPGDDQRATVLRGDWLFAGWSGGANTGAPAGRIVIWRRVGGAWTQQQTLLAPAGGPPLPTIRGFGHDLAVTPDGKRLVASDPAQRAVYTWQRDAGGSYALNAGATLNNPLAAPPAMTLKSMRVTTDGLTLVVHSSLFDAKIWRWSGQAWQPEATPAGALSQPSWQWSSYGAAAALDGDAALVSAPSAFVSGPQGLMPAGRVAQLTRSAGGTWALAATFTDDAPAIYQAFGAALARAGDVLAVGSPTGGCGAAGSNGSTRGGHVSVFTRSGGSWQFSHKLAPDHLACAPGATFGSALALDGGELYVGAQRQPSPWTPGALGAIFRYSPGTSGVFGLTDTLTASAPLLPLVQTPIMGLTDYQRLGAAVAVDGGRVVAWAALDPGGSRPSRTLIFEPQPGAATVAGLCLCAPGFSGPTCAVQSCNKPADCDDGDPCTSDLCLTVANQLVKVCSYGVPQQKFVPCEDGDACTESDACSQGVCKAGSLKDCNDGVFCTADSCDPKTGGCTHALVKGCKG